MLSDFIEVLIDELTVMRLGIQGSIHGIFTPMLPMLQLSRALKNTAASGFLMFMILDQETLSVHIVMLSIGRQRKTAMMYLQSAA
jgi:hypothetical protein